VLILSGGLGAEHALAECERLDDPLQILDFYLEMDPVDWDIVRHDAEFETERPAMFRACDEAPLPVMVRRKRLQVSPEDDDPIKVSLKVDFDDRVPNGEWHGQRKLSLESGRGLGRGTLLREGLAWQLMAQAGLIVGGSAWARVHMNGSPLGMYTRVEQIDKSFLRRHIQEDDGFLYKLDYSVPGRRKRLTREGEADPYAPNLCYLPFDETCAMPAGALAELPRHLDLNQLFTMAAVNAFVSNFDGPFISENNYYWYNSSRPRLYFPWDLDLVLLTGFEELDPYQAVRESDWLRVLFQDPALKEYFDAVLSRLLEDAFSFEVLGRFLDELAPVIGPAMSADPRNDFDGTFSFELAKLRRFFRARVDYLRAKLPTPQPFPVVINEVLAQNASINADEGGHFADWVELYNRSAGPASLAGLYLSDDPAEPRRWRLPDLVLPAGGFILIWCDRAAVEGPLHAGFQLDADGEGVGLYEALDRAPPGSYRAADFVRFGPQERDISLGRFPDGAPGFRRLECPTPSAANRAACAPEILFTRGEVNGDGALNITDAVRLLLGLFSGEGLPCGDAADTNDDGDANLTDAVAILFYLFRTGPPPSPPHPGCGSDPTLDSMDCKAAPACR
jgi:hypothetical protein